MAANLERIFDARRELVAWASHDLRTPIASLQAMLEAIEDGIAEPPTLPARDARAGADPRQLVDDLFELARIDAGASRSSCAKPSSPGSSSRACAASRRRRRASSAGRGADRAASRRRCAPEKVERVLYNLLTNALRHTPSDGSVAVLVSLDSDEVEVTVEDTGDGLDTGAPREDVRPLLARRPARTSGEAGAGLGLAIARGLVEAHGGRIWAEPRPEGGTRVSFTLPGVA